MNAKRTVRTYDFQVLESLLNCLINGNDDGLSVSEERAIHTFWDDTVARYGDGHWDCDAEYSEDFGTCDITGEWGKVCQLRYVVVYDTPKHPLLELWKSAKADIDADHTSADFSGFGALFWSEATLRALSDYLDAGGSIYMFECIFEALRNRAPSA